MECCDCICIVFAQPHPDLSLFLFWLLMFHDKSVHFSCRFIFLGKCFLELLFTNINLCFYVTTF